MDIMDGWIDGWMVSILEAKLSYFKSILCSLDLSKSKNTQTPKII